MSKPRNVHVKLDCTGNDGGFVTLKWGHPDKDDDGYFKPFLRAFRGQAEAAFNFVIADKNSEFEVQTEGGRATGYRLRIWFGAPEPDGPSVVPSGPPPLPADLTAVVPNLELVFNYSNVAGQPAKTDFRNNGGVFVRRSAGPNGTGEQNVRVDLDGSNAGPIP